jgi:lysophospholipase L1-like esterase|nr:SGNH/GDSL hydrolase family protein [uncultured Pedobacter sp.]
MKILILLGSLFLFGACTKKSDPVVFNNPNPAVTPVITGSLTYLALGDSYTIGQSVETSQNFPNQLVTQLKAENINVSNKIIAQTGWTTGDLISAIQSATLEPKYDFVTLLIGVNNQYRGYNIDDYRTEFIQLLQTSIKYAGGNASRVFVLSIPDYSVTPFAGNNVSVTSQIATEIDAYNKINKQETANLKANYLDITPISREAKTNPNLIAPDGLHPSAEMYSAWIKLLAPQVQSHLK